MADEEEKTVVEAGKNEANESDGKGGGSKKLILLGGVGFGAVVLGVVLALFVVKPMMGGSGDGSEQEQGTEEVAEAEHEESHGDHKGAEGFLCTIEDIIVNPAGTGGSRYLSASFSFSMKSSKAKSAFEKNEYVIRDALITILSSKTVAQLTNSREKEIVRYQIKKRISKLLKTKGLEGVYYTNFVLQ